MPEVAVKGGRIAYLVDGPAEAPVLLLSNSLGTTLDSWSKQVAPLSRSFRVVRYDTRGHGRSVVSPAPYSLDLLGRDALAVLDAVGARRAHVCGLSLGGLTAMWLALHAAGRIGRLVLASTAPRIGNAEGWDQRIRDVRSLGLAAVSEAALPRWFTADFRQREPGIVEVMRSMVAACAPEGYIGCCGALRDADLRGRLSAIPSPTLVLAGTDDPVTTVADGEALRDGIPSARLATLRAAHLSNIEQADAFTAAVSDFLSAREVTS